ncbi:zinc-dependent alcohol dehydrogenase family protein [Gryllotalpicola ginsengisoli]|uniref:zinc-dependent alcohol dehydrogenase family protein n=1 Tax=Gryllotalpicola ginsengisoli TaxID=444608 RepID=UPI0003B59B40|nr:zinc-dependent alcohol dehydrogenase family protein [Gryllotalpicola ginsengisoli]
MRATVIHGERDVRLEEVPDPALSGTGTDAIVRVVAACVCGSDLWRYRGVNPVREPARIGHEFVGVVEQIGDRVEKIRVGDFVIAPFYDCDMTCANCRNGFSPSCLEHGAWGGRDHWGNPVDGAQGEYVRVPHADGSLVATPEQPADELVPHLLTLADVFGTGHHAAVAAGVGPGRTVVVLGDGAVGLSGVLASRRLGAERIVLMSRHAPRQALGREFGATDVIEARGDEGVAAVKELFDGIGADCVLECVGTGAAMEQAIASARPGGQVGFVGVPAEGNAVPVRRLFNTNVGLRGGVAPVRNYLDELLPEVWRGELQPGRVFDLTLPLAEVGEAYAAMDERRAIKVLLQP